MVLMGKNWLFMPVSGTVCPTAGRVAASLLSAVEVASSVLSATLPALSALSAAHGVDTVLEGGKEIAAEYHRVGICDGQAADGTADIGALVEDVKYLEAQEARVVGKEALSKLGIPDGAVFNDVGGVSVPAEIVYIGADLHIEGEIGLQVSSDSVVKGFSLGSLVDAVLHLVIVYRSAETPGEVAETVLQRGALYEAQGLGVIAQGVGLQLVDVIETDVLEVCGNAGGVEHVAGEGSGVVVGSFVVAEGGVGAYIPAHGTVKRGVEVDVARGGPTAIDIHQFGNPDACTGLVEGHI